MKWVNHKIITTSVAYMASQSLEFTIGAFIGSTLPDAVEGKEGKRLTLKNHRQASHQIFVYFLMFIIFCLVSLIAPGSFTVHVILSVGMGVFFGAMMHIVEDAVTGTVPHPFINKKRIGKVLFRVGSYQEYLISLICVCILLFFVVRI